MSKSFALPIASHKIKQESRFSVLEFDVNPTEAIANSH